MKISIIIPVYNSLKYLDECLSSLRKQTYKDLEFILVDDGSKDDSLSLCKKYAKEDERFRVFHKENGGTSSARNYGLKKVTGDYITFLDNDDYIKDEDVFEKVAKILKKEKVDILFHRCIYYWDDTKRFTYPNVSAKSGRYESKESLIKEGLYTYTVWDKIYKSSIIKENNIEFENGKRNEDSEFNLKIFPLAKKYYYFDTPFYVYRKATSYAQTSILKYSHLNDLKNIIEEYINDDPDMQNYIAYLYAVYLAQGTLLKTKEDIEYMKKYKYLLKRDLNPSMKMVSTVYKLLGFNITRHLLSLYISRKYKLATEDNKTK